MLRPAVADSAQMTAIGSAPRAWALCQLSTRPPRYSNTGCGPTGIGIGYATVPVAAIVFTCLISHIIRVAPARFSLVDAEDGSNGDQAVDVGRTIQRVETHDVFALAFVLNLKPIRVACYYVLARRADNLLIFTPISAPNFKAISLPPISGSKIVSSRAEYHFALTHFNTAFSRSVNAMRTRICIWSIAKQQCYVAKSIPPSRYESVLQH